MSELTTRLGLPLIAASQAQKHVPVNEALVRLDSIVQLSVLGRTLTAPPGSPSEGDRYIVAAAASGAWAGQDGKVTAYDGGWIFLAPSEGWLAWDAGARELLIFRDGGWTLFSAGRDQLEAARTYYVRTDGSDANDGMTDSSAGAFATWQHAIDVASSLDTMIHDVVVQAGSEAGTRIFDIGAGLKAKQCVGAGRIILRGDLSTPANVVLQLSGTVDATMDGVLVAEGISTKYLIEGFKLSKGAASGQVNCLYAILAVVSFGNIAFDGTGFTHMCRAEDNGVVKNHDSFSIEGSCSALLASQGGGVIRVRAGTATMVATPSFSAATVFAADGGHVFINGLTWAGSANAASKKFDLSMNATLRTNGASASIPGGAAGTAGSGGQFN